MLDHHAYVDRYQPGREPMLRARLSRRYLRGVVRACLTVAVLIWGCTSREVPPPSQSPADVSQRLAALEECIARSQRAVTAAADVGVSTGALAPVNSSIADAQDALDEAHKLAQQRKQPEAAERATKGLEECDKIGSMVAKARQDTAERIARAQLASAAEERIVQTAACVDGARQVVRRASATRAKSTEVAAARDALDSAETALKQARELRAQNDPKGALWRLDTAQAECQVAREKAATPGKAASPPAKPRRSQ